MEKSRGRFVFRYENQICLTVELVLSEWKIVGSFPIPLPLNFNFEKLPLHYHNVKKVGMVNNLTIVNRFVLHACPGFGDQNMALPHFCDHDDPLRLSRPRWRRRVFADRSGHGATKII